MCHIKPHILRANVKVKVILQGQRSNWRSKTCNFNNGHNFSPIADSNLIFGIWIHLTKTHNLMGDMSRSRSYFKVKGQIEVKKCASLTLTITFHLLQLVTWYLACNCISLRCTFSWVTCHQGQGHSSWSNAPTGGHSVSQTHLVLSCHTFSVTLWFITLAGNTQVTGNPLSPISHL